MNKKVKIFSADYLMNNELTDEDLKTLLGDHQLIYSLIVEMFKISKHTPHIFNLTYIPIR